MLCRAAKRCHPLPALLCLLLLLLAAAGCQSGTSHTDPAPPGPDEQRVSFSLPSGCYEEEQLTVSISAPDGCTVAFTEDGRLPTIADDSGLQTAEVSVENMEPGYLIRHRDLMVYSEFPRSCILEDPSLPGGCVVRAAVVSPSGEVGPVETEVYFPDLDPGIRFPGCLVISIIADPSDLLDYETGILTPGAIYDQWKETPEGIECIAGGELGLVESNITQHGKAWERPCTLQIYDGSGSPAVRADAGIRITGGFSRGANQKSFNLYFRDTYGTQYLEYPLFEDVPRYKSFRLRSGGNNANLLKFRDAFLQDLVADRRFTTTESRPAVLFLNGEYWGPYLLTEKLSDQMLHDHYGVDPDQVILVKEGELEEGVDDDMALYQDLMAYADADLSDPVLWQEFSAIMDTQSMAEYCAARVYYGDADWRPDKNDVLWRTRDTSYNDGRWQYILYDVEYSTGLYGSEQTAASYDHYSAALRNYPLLAAALKNEAFREAFLEALRSIGSVDCNYERVQEILTSYLKVWEPLMPDYYKRFGDWQVQWYMELARMDDFFRQRYDLLLPTVTGDN